MKCREERRILNLINQRTMSQGPFDNILHSEVKTHSQMSRVLLVSILGTVCEVVKNQDVGIFLQVSVTHKL